MVQVREHGATLFSFLWTISDAASTSHINAAHIRDFPHNIIYSHHLVKKKKRQFHKSRNFVSNMLTFRASSQFSCEPLDANAAVFGTESSTSAQEANAFLL